MTVAPPRPRLVLLLALAFGSLSPSQARAEAPAKELRLPPAPSQELADLLAAGRDALPTDLHAAFDIAVVDAQVRLLASMRAAANGAGEPMSIEGACRAAISAGDFAGASKRKTRVVDGLVALAALQLTFDLRATLRERLGRQLAIQSVHACRDAAACLDAIAATPDMPARHIAAVRKQFEGKGEDLEAEGRLGSFEIDQLFSNYAKVTTADRMRKQVLDFIRG